LIEIAIKSGKIPAATNFVTYYSVGEQNSNAQVLIMAIPIHLSDPAFKALRLSDLETFRRLTADHKQIDFSNTDLRGTDLRKVDLTRIVLTGAYLKECDLRGQDMRHMNLSGVSIHGAKIGGVYFPGDIDASEIAMSVSMGTRMRTFNQTV